MEKAKKKSKELTLEEKQQKINSLMEELQKEKEKGKDFILSLLSSRRINGRWQSYFDGKSEYLIQNAIRNGITEKHSGKMEGMQSYSTCCAINKACLRAAHPGCYCHIKGNCQKASAEQGILGTRLNEKTSKRGGVTVPKANFKNFLIFPWIRSSGQNKSTYYFFLEMQTPSPLKNFQKIF